MKLNTILQLTGSFAAKICCCCFTNSVSAFILLVSFSLTAETLKISSLTGEGGALAANAAARI